MKIKYFILFLVLIVNVVLGQTVSKRISIEDKGFNSYFLNKDNMPHVKGKIINLTPTEISKTKIEYIIVTPFKQLQVQKNCLLNTDGSFEFELEYAFPYQQIWITVDSLFYTGVYANSDLFVELDAAVLKKQKEVEFNGPGVKFLGHDGALNVYTNNHILFKRKEQLEIGNAIQGILPTARTDYNSFIKKYDSIYSVLYKLDDEYIRKNPSEFSWLLINERQSNYLADLCYVHWGKQMPPELFEMVKNHKAYATSNEGMLFYNYLVAYLKTITANKLAANKVSYNPVEGAIQTIGMFDSLFSQSKSDFFKIKFSSGDPKDQKLIMETVLPYIKTEWCKTAIKKEYSKTLKKLAEINKILDESKSVVSGYQLGQPIAELSFGAQLYRVDSTNVDTLISMIKHSFKNKALLIDFWATWCSPCIAEFPYSKKLNDDTKDLPVEFIYLCTSDGSDLEKWKSKIAEYKLSGTHIFIEKSIESRLMSLFSVSGYPSYLFINSKGEYKPNLNIRPSQLNKDKLAELVSQ